MLFLLGANLSPELVKSSRVASFAADTSIVKTISTKENSTLLQADLRIDSSSSPSNLAFNESKCKAQRITRKLRSIIACYELSDHALETSFAGKSPSLYNYF